MSTVRVELSPVESSLAVMALEERGALISNAERKFGVRVQPILTAHNVPEGIRATIDRAPDGSCVLLYDDPTAAPPSEN